LLAFEAKRWERKACVSPNFFLLCKNLFKLDVVGELLVCEYFIFEGLCIKKMDM
jgi:hypothetical protein